MRLPHAWVHVPACAQNMLSHLIDADTHKYTPFCSTSTNQGRRFQKARACWVKNTFSLPRRLLVLTPCSFSSYFFLMISFSPDISFPWHFFLLTSLLLLAFFLFDISFSSRLVSWNLSLDMSNTSPQQHWRSNWLGRAGVGLQSTKAGPCVLTASWAC